MAQMTRREYEALKLIKMGHERLTYGGTMAINKDRHYIDLEKLSPEELIRYCHNACVDMRPARSNMAALMPPCPTSKGGLIRAAFDELIFRYRTSGREWLLAENAKDRPTTEPV